LTTWETVPSDTCACSAICFIVMVVRIQWLDDRNLPLTQRLGTADLRRFWNC
jgi:hypothetical protein